MKQSAPAKSLGSEPECPPPRPFVLGTLVSSVQFTKAHTVYTHFLAPQSNWLSLNVVGSCGAILRFFDCLFNVSYLLYDRDEREYPGGQRQVLRTAQAPLWSIVQWP